MTQTPPSLGPPRTAGGATHPLRVLHVLGGAADPAAGVTGVERVVQSLFEGLDAARFQHYAAYPPTGALADFFAARSCAVLSLQPRRRWDRNWSAAVAAFLRQHAIDLVVSHGMRFDFLCALACRQTRTPHLVSRAAPLAGEAAMSLPRKLLYGLVDTWTLHHCTGVVTVSEASKKRMQATQGLRARRIEVIPNGVRLPVVGETARLAARAALGVAGAELLIGAAGRLVRGKGFDVLVDAVGGLRAGTAPLAPVTLVLLGEGPERGRLERRARALGVRLVLPGYLQNPYPTLAALDVAVLPSWAEGMPLVVLESMALGVPTIASRVGGIGEIIVDGESGLLIAPGDATGLAQSLRRLLEAPALRQRLGAAAALRVRTHFGLDAMLTAFAATLRRGAGVAENAADAVAPAEVAHHDRPAAR